MEMWHGFHFPSINLLHWCADRNPGVNVRRRSVAGSLKGPVHTCRVQGSLWCWGALIGSQITSNCLKQKLSLSGSCLLTGPFTSTAENIKTRQEPPPEKTHTHTHTAHLPPTSLAVLRTAPSSPCQLADTYRLAQDKRRKKASVS